MTQATALRLSAAIGRALRAHRLQRRDRQDDVARAARLVGLPWTRTTVAKTERGERAVTLEEALLLAMALNIRLADLVGEDADIVLSAETRVSAVAVRAILEGQTGGAVAVGEIDAPFTRQAADLAAAVGERVTQAAQSARWVWPEASGFDLMAAAKATTEAGGDADSRIAKKLDLNVLELAVASYRLWRTSFTAERDRRVSSLATTKGPSSSSRTMQALRGHVSRDLIGELQDLLRITRQKGKVDES